MPILSNLIAKLTLESSEYESGMKGASAAAKQFGKDSGSVEQGTSKASKGIDVMGKVVGGIVASGVMIKAGQMAIQFGKESIDAASSAEQGYGKFQAVFKDSADSVEAELGAMADEIKRSKIDLMAYASTLQDTFVPLGFARDKAAEFSVELVGLAEDLASFNDLPTADVVRDLQSALVGNTETLRKYGVVANETAIKQKALEMGLWDGTGAIDAQSKALAIYEILLDGTADAQGTAAREADTYDSATRGLEAAILDLKVAFGNELLPTLTDGKDVLADVVGSIATAISFSQELTRAVENGTITQQEANDIYFKAASDTYTLAEAKEWLTKKEDEWKNELNEGAKAAASADQLFQNYVNTQEDAIEVVDELTRSQEDLKQELKDLELFIKGPLGKEQKDWAERSEDLRKRSYDLEAAIQALQDEEHLTPEQLDQLNTMQAEYDALQLEFQESKDEHQKSTESILFDLLTQRAAVDGLSEVELKFLNDTAYKWGLVDDATHQAVGSIDKAMGDLAEGNIKDAQREIEALRDAADSAAGTYNIYFKITQSGSIPSPKPSVGGPPVPQPKALGGYADAYSSYLVGEQGPELFIPNQSGMVVPNDATMAYIQGLQAVDYAGLPDTSAGGNRMTVYDGIHLYGVQNTEQLLAELSGLMG